MTASPDNWIVREGRDPERELTSLQKRFAAITCRFERTVHWKNFIKALRVDALAACAVFLVAFAAMMVSPPPSAVKRVLATVTEGRFSVPTSLTEEASSEVLSLEETQPEDPVVQTGAAEVHFRNCDAAWAAGAAPIYIGEPGYESRMDGDHDGIACEPWRGRR
jgi:hypothetical protein